MKAYVAAAALMAATIASTAAPAETALQRVGDDHGTLQQDAISNLRQAGYTDVRTVTGSSLVQAKDKSGNTVTLIVGNMAQGNMTIGTGTGSPTDQANNAPGGAFTTVPPKDSLGSKVIGLEVYNMAKQSIGTIKDVAFNGNGIDGYVLSVGGFLGIGDHYVAVRPSAVKVTFDRSDNRWHATMDANADQLKAAPEFKYPSSS